MTIIDVLEQDKVWLGQGGMPYKIEEMKQRHRINVLRFLAERAEDLYRQKAWDEEKYLRNAPDDVLRAYESECSRMISQEPLQWLEGTPLVRALMAAVRREEALAPDSPGIEA